MATLGDNPYNNSFVCAKARANRIKGVANIGGAGLWTKTRANSYIFLFF